jgi:hypothetical protein
MPAAWGSSEHWRERAEEARTLAEKMSNVRLKRAMLEIAEGYEHLAERAAEAAAALPAANQAVR